MPATAEWTFLLYMDSPDDEQEVADTELLHRLEKLVTGKSKFNLVFDIGHGDVRHRGRIVGGKTDYLQTVPRTETISHAITSFVDWAEEAFPSRFTALSLRDHGSALAPAAWPSARSRNWLLPTAAAPRLTPGKRAKKPHLTAKITGNGASRGGQALNGSGIRTAISQTKKGRVDVYCFDACSMGMLEFAYEVRQVARYVVAAELVIGVKEFPYPEAIAYATNGEPSSALGMALATAKGKSDHFAAVDTGWLETLAAAVGALGEYLNTQQLKELLSLRADVPSTADSGVDIKQLVEKIKTKFAGSGKARSLVVSVNRALARAVLSKGANVRGKAGGLALSFPQANTIGYMLGYAGLTFGRKNPWASFLFDYIPMCVDKYVYRPRR